MYNYTGAIHIHSTYSDGGKNIDYIIKQAQKAKLDWIIINDHNTLNGIKHEGFYDGLCVIAGYEVTPGNANHLLTFGTTETIDETLDTKKQIDLIHEQGGFCIPAHPDENIHRNNRHKPLRWDDWSIDTFDGIEIWNYLTDWTDNYSISKSKLLQYFFRHKMVKGPTKNVLAWWDRLNINNKNKKIYCAIGGLDTHAFSLNRSFMNIRLADYYDYFTGLNNKIYLNEQLSENFAEAKKQILNAIKNGNNILVNRKITRNTNIDFYILNKNNKIYAGNFAAPYDYSKLILKLPQKATIRVIHNGVLIFENNSKIMQLDDIKTGVYRVEVYKNNLPWIFTNPIVIK